MIGIVEKQKQFVEQWMFEESMMTELCETKQDHAPQGAKTRPSA